MLLEPTLASPQARGAELPPAVAELLPLVGSTLTLSVLAVEQQGVRVATPQGLTLLLPGLAEAGLQAGSQLLMQVLATEPRLQLARVVPQLEVAPAPAEPAPMPALVSQAVTPRWSMVKPGAEQLAAGWRGVLQAVMLPAAGTGSAGQPWLLAGQRLMADPLLQAQRLAEQGWHLVHAWPGQTLHLGLEQHTAAANPVEETLLLKLDLPPWGEIWMRVAASAAGLLLQLGCERALVLAAWQPRLAGWRQALLHAGIVLAELQLCLAAVCQLSPYRLTAGTVSLPQSVQFRLAAHMLLLLQAAAEQETAAAQLPPLPQEVDRDD